MLKKEKRFLTVWSDGNWGIQDAENAYLAKLDEPNDVVSIPLDEIREQLELEQE
jgi:hypothetical protein